MQYPVYEIDPRIAQNIYTTASEIAFQGGEDLFTTEDGINQLALQSREAICHLGLDTPDEIKDFAKQGNPTGMVVLRGLKIPQEIDAVHPNVGHMPNTFESRTMGVMATMAASLLGTPISYTTNPRGKVQSFVSQVAPAKIDERTAGTPRFNEVRTGRSTGWHSEAGTAPVDKKIQFLSLLCVRPQAEVATKVISSVKLTEAIIRMHGGDRLHELGQSAYLLPEPIIPGSETIRRPIAVKTDRGIAYTYGESYKDHADSVTRHALDSIATAIKSVTPASHALDAGDVLYVDNHGLHCRDEFTPRRRWLMRVFVGQEGMDTFVDPSDIENMQ